MLGTNFESSASDSLNLDDGSSDGDGLVQESDSDGEELGLEQTSSDNEHLNRESGSTDNDELDLEIDSTDDETMELAGGSSDSDEMELDSKTSNNRELDFGRDGSLDHAELSLEGETSALVDLEAEGTPSSDEDDSLVDELELESGDDGGLDLDAAIDGDSDNSLKSLGPTPEEDRILSDNTSLETSLDGGSIEGEMAASVQKDPVIEDDFSDGVLADPVVGLESMDSDLSGNLAAINIALVKLSMASTPEKIRDIALDALQPSFSHGAIILMANDKAAPFLNWQGKARKPDYKIEKTELVSLQKKILSDNWSDLTAPEAASLMKAKELRQGARATKVAISPQKSVIFVGVPSREGLVAEEFCDSAAQLLRSIGRRTG